MILIYGLENKIFITTSAVIFLMLQKIMGIYKIYYPPFKSKIEAELINP